MRCVVLTYPKMHIPSHRTSGRQHLYRFHEVSQSKKLIIWNDTEFDLTFQGFHSFDLATMEDEGRTVMPFSEIPIRVSLERPRLGNLLSHIVGQGEASGALIYKIDLGEGAWLDVSCVRWLALPI
jgi:hypothetical protein